jgi:hypothetical protein
MVVRFIAMNQIRIANQTVVFERVTFVAYHCSAATADWNLCLEREGAMSYLSGTITPAPRTASDLAGASVRVDLRSLDEVAEGILGRPITLYPGGQSVCALSFPIERSATGARFAINFDFEWDHALGTFPVAGTMESGTIELEAEVGALHPNAPPR